MGWTDRLHSLVTATTGALEAPVGFVKDVGIALPELATLDLPAFTHDVYHSILDRSGAEIGSLIGPTGIGGTLVGAAPSQVRQAVDPYVSTSQDLMDRAYHDLVGKPLATAVTAATFAKQDGVDDLFNPQTYAESWDIADHRSPGQSLALAFLTKDMRDPAQVRKAQGSDWYTAISGVTDALARVYLDPTALALGGASDALKASRFLNSQEAIEHLTTTGAVSKFADDVGQIVADHGDGAAAVIRHTYFPHDPLGAHMADLLANTDKLPSGLIDGLSGAAARERVTRILMGATDEIEALRNTRPDLAGQIDRMVERRDMLKSVSTNGFELANSPEDLAHIDRELNSLYSQRQILDRAEHNTATMQSLPRTGGPVAARGRFTLGDFYQHSIFAKPLHVMTQMEEHPWIHLDDPSSDISVARMLAKSELPLPEQLTWRSRYMGEATAAGRMSIATQAEDAAVASIAAKAGMSSDEINALLAESYKGRTLAKRALDSRAYDGEGRSVITLDGEDGVAHKLTIMDAPLYETQLPNLHPMVDLDKVKEVVSPIHRFLQRVPGHEVAPDLLHQFADVWKPAVLLRVGFPVRFLTDETLRSISKIGALATLKNLGQGGVDAVGAALEKVGFAPREMEGLNIAGHEFEGAFGAPGDGAAIYKKLIEARESFGTLVSEHEGRTLEQLIQSGPWRSVNPTEAAYPSSWEHAVNNQIGKSELGSRLLDEMISPIGKQFREAGAATYQGEPATVLRTAGTDAEGKQYLHLEGHDKPVPADEVKFPGVHAPSDAGRAIKTLPASAEPYTDIPAGHVRLFRGESGGELEGGATQGRNWSHSADFAKRFAKGDDGRVLYVDLPVDEAGNVPAGWSLGDNETKAMQAQQAKAAAGELDRVPVHHYAEGPELAQTDRSPIKTKEQVVSNVVDWLKNNPNGQRIADSLPIRKDFEKWVGSAYDQIDSYLPTDRLKAGASFGRATHDELVAQIPNASDRPLVHGGVVAEQMGGPIGKAWRKIVDTGMQNLVGKPSNYLMRQPFFDHMYQAELSRQVGLITGEQQLSLPKRMLRFIGGHDTSVEGAHGIELTADDMTRMEIRARRYALRETKDLFHNFAEEFTFAKNLGMLAPFANAWGQITSRWAGIAIDNPAFVRRLQVVWRSPERAGLVTDGAGNTVDEHGKITSPVKNSQYRIGDNAADGQRNVTLHLPSWAHDVPGLKNTGDFEFGKDSLNLIMHGLPPVGPIVQVAANEIAKTRPELEPSLKWALPYGVTQNSLDILKPTLVRRLQASSEGDANRSYAYTAMRIYTDKVVDYNLGKRKDKPTWKEAESDAHAFWHMRTVASYVLPTSPQFTSPYQPYIDAYQARKDLDAKLTPEQRAQTTYKTPDEWFLDTFGNEFFPLVASMSKSLDGIPPTLAGQKIHEEFGDLLAQHPDLGSLISGEEGAGEFSRAVYEAQFQQKIGEGSSSSERTVQPFDEFRNQASVKAGWIEFGRVMDTLDSLRVQRGLPSFNVKGAADLMAAKQATIQYLATSDKYTGWYEDYGSTDSTKWDQRIAGMTAIVKNDKLGARPEFQGLKKYLSARASVVDALGTLGVKNLHTQTAAAVLSAFDQYAAQMVDENPAFGALYNRWLQNDPVAITPLTAAAESGTLDI